VSGIDVDAIAPATPELWKVARRRCDPIIKAWAARIAIWGTGGLHGHDGNLTDETFTLRDLAMSAYVQGARDATAVAVTMPEFVGLAPAEKETPR